jgi:(E)-4-hydroxy-3-methylbut-2-enyl-diphosphate synthase
MNIRQLTKPIRVGNRVIGGSNKVLIQTMCDMKTSNYQKVIEQIHRLEALGCDVVRVSVVDQADVDAIKLIKRDIHIPLVADIHFDYKLALGAIASGVDKIRINPGNIGGYDKIKLVVEACKLNKVAIRVGINGGSLEKDIEEKYGHNNAEGMVESVKRNVKIIEDLGYDQIIISIKSSDVIQTIKANQMIAKIYNYPLHIGITEAGDLSTSAVRSSFGLGLLLYEGIGDTIRVSITDSPETEIKVCKELLKSVGLRKNHPTLISCPTCGRMDYDMVPVVERVKKHLETLTIDISVAIMGCVVNGPGEARNADVGIAGGKNSAMLFRKGQIIKKLTTAEAADVLIEEINQIVKEKELLIK